MGDGSAPNPEQPSAFLYLCALYYTNVCLFVSFSTLCHRLKVQSEYYFALKVEHIHIAFSAFRFPLLL